MYQHLVCHHPVSMHGDNMNPNLMKWNIPAVKQIMQLSVIDLQFLFSFYAVYYGVQI